MTSATRAAVVLMACLFAGLPSVLAEPGPAPEGPDPYLEQGESLYRIYCRSCHGDRAEGDGPAAATLRVRPTDLTRLSARNGGEFPFDQVFRTIDGRERVRGHGETAMPFWGLSFQQLDQDTDQENEVQARILKLTHYLRSIQRVPGTKSGD